MLKYIFWKPVLRARDSLLMWKHTIIHKTTWMMKYHLQFEECYHVFFSNYSFGMARSMYDTSILSISILVGVS